jgi:hypothetical protein
LIKIKQRDRSCEEDNESILEYLSFAVGWSKDGVRTTDRNGCL